MGIDERILIIDDDVNLCNFIQILLSNEGYKSDVAYGFSEGMKKIDEIRPSVVLLDVKLKDGDGLELLKIIKDKYPETEIIMITAFSTTDLAIKSIQLGAYDYITKPFDNINLLEVVRHAYKKTNIVGTTEDYNTFIGKSEAVKNILFAINTIKDLPNNVLIQGESGTGKELVARLIHQKGRYSKGPFVAVNCAAIPEGLFESELFGHVKGSFTGATQDKVGMFEEANGGIIFLDEIGELPLSVQVKLLRVIEERAIRRVGENKSRPISVRIIAATNRDLEQEVKKGNFREDLFYRLNVVRIYIKPLRERKEDIPELAYYFLKKYAALFNKKIDSISKEAMEILLNYYFPGNVRELENIIERGVSFENKNYLSVSSLPYELIGGGEVFEEEQSKKLWADFNKGSKDLDSYIEGIEKGLIKEALRKAKGVKVRAAELLGITFRSLRHRLEKYKID